jgi:hypothetical protein
MASADGNRPGRPAGKRPPALPPAIRTDGPRGGDPLASRGRAADSARAKPRFKGAGCPVLGWAGLKNGQSGIWVAASETRSDRLRGALLLREEPRELVFVSGIGFDP